MSVTSLRARMSQASDSIAASSLGQVMLYKAVSRRDEDVLPCQIRISSADPLLDHGVTLAQPGRDGTE
ncbi:hypothetical protein [Streptomyces sp. NPDC055036]